MLCRLSSKDPHMLSLLHEVMQFALNHVIIQPIHHPGCLNVVADFLSQFQECPSFLNKHGLVATPREVPREMFDSLLS